MSRLPLGTSLASLLHQQEHHYYFTTVTAGLYIYLPDATKKETETRKEQVGVGFQKQSKVDLIMGRKRILFFLAHNSQVLG